MGCKDKLKITVFWLKHSGHSGFNDSGYIKGTYECDEIVKEDNVLYLHNEDGGTIIPITKNVMDIQIGGESCRHLHK